MISRPASPDHHHLHLFRDHRWAVGTATALYLAAAALLAVAAFDGGLAALRPIDAWWHDTMVASGNDVLTVVARGFDVAGGVWVIWPLRAVMGAVLAATRRWAKFVMWVTAAALSEASIGLLKALYDRPRPPDPLVDTSGASFPSGHATAGAATAVALVIVLLAPGEHRRAWEVRAGLFAFAMALSRTYLRAHWLSDVVAGVLLGTATAIAVAAVVQLVRVRIELARREAVGTERRP
jgi:undecaprenyl-diphosphatase